MYRYSNGQDGCSGYERKLVFVGMQQEMIAGIIFCVMGLSMLLLPPKTLWKITEKWKIKGSGRPSDKYVLIARILGGVFAAVGGWLLISR